MKSEEYEVTTTDEYTFNVKTETDKESKITWLEITCPSNLQILQNRHIGEVKKCLERIIKTPFCSFRTSKINLNNNLEELGMNAIWYTNIQILTLPSSMKTLHDYSIADCHQLKEIILNDGLEIIGQHALRGDPIETITLPSSIKYLAPNSFCGCEKLQNINIPENVIEKYDNEFNLQEHLGCPNSSITITKPKTKILHK